MAATSAAAVAHNDATTSAYGMSIAAATRCRLVVLLVRVLVDVDLNMLRSAPLSKDVPSARESSAAPQRPAICGAAGKRALHVAACGAARRRLRVPSPRRKPPFHEAPFASFCPRSPLSAPPIVTPVRPRPTNE